MIEWFEASKIIAEEYGTQVDYEEEFFICPECGEPIYKEDTMELIGTFNSIKEASRYATDNYGCSFSGMIRNYRSKGYKLVKKKCRD